MVAPTNERTIGPHSSVPDPVPYVLLHGAWHDGSAWADVKAALEAAGCQVHTPTLGGHGPEAPTRHVTLAACAAPVIDCLVQHDLHRVTLVAHSFAGLIVPLVVEALPERISHLVFVSAIIPVPGQNAFYGTPVDDAALTQHDDGTVSLPLEVWLQRFWQDETAEPALASPERGEAVWRSRLFPESFAAAMEPASLPRFAQMREAGLPATYIRCRGDQVFGDPAIWQIMVDRLPGCRVIEIDGSHEVLFTRPVALAETLLAVTQATVEVPG